MIQNEGLIPLGKTDILVTPIGIGAWSWGDSVFWGYGRDYGETDVKAAFDISIEAGVNFFDTAEAYGQGHSETLLGQFLRDTPLQPGKPPIIVATKFFPYPWRLWKASLKQALIGSLRRLQIEKVGLYQIHWPFPPVSIEAWATALADVFEEGLVEAVGVSNYNAQQMRRAQATLIKRSVLLASNQVEYSLINRKIEKNGLLDLCQDLGVCCIAYSPLGKGTLTGKYSPQNPLRGMRGRRYNSRFLSQIEPLIRLLREIGRAHDGKTPAQVALNWVICKGAIPIPGAKNIQQAQENVGALGWRLAEEEVSALDQASDRLV